MGVSVKFVTHTFATNICINLYFQQNIRKQHSIMQNIIANIIQKKQWLIIFDPVKCFKKLFPIRKAQSWEKTRIVMMLFFFPGMKWRSTHC